MKDHYRFNINNHIKVRLTWAGCLHLADQHNELAESCPSLGIKRARDYALEADGLGYTTFQMWSFINTFGPLTSLGAGGKYYSTEILIPKNVCEEN